MLGGARAAVLSQRSIAQQIVSALGGDSGVPAILLDSTMTNAGGVSPLWFDPRGTSYAGGGLSASGSARPSYLVDARGKPYLSFDGVANVMQSGAFTLPAPCTLILVMRQVSWTVGDVLVDGRTLNSANLQQRTSTPRVAFSGGFDVSTWPLASMAVVELQINNPNSSIRINEGTASVGNTGLAGALAGLTIGGAGNLSAFANIDVQAAVAANFIPSATQLANARAILGRNSGLAAYS